MRYLFGFLMALAVLAFAACGDNDGNCVEPVDVAGEWEMTSTVVSDNCDGRVDQTYQMTITQDGNALTGETEDFGIFSGTICGDRMQLKGSFPEDGGTVTVNATLMVSADGESMQGSDNWTWTDGSESCSGSDSLSGTRIMTGGCEGAVDGTACSGGACLDGACTALTTVSGTVTVDDINNVSSPAVGATVSVLGTSLSTTTNERGEFSFGVFTGDWFFQASKPGTWGWIEQESVPAAGRSDLETGVLTDGFMVELENLLQIDVDDTKGMIWMTFLPNSGRGGETATLSESRDGGLTDDADSNWAASEELLPGGSPDLGFYGVGLTEELSVMPKGVAGVNECTLNEPELVYPIRAKHLTVGVGITCDSIP